MSTTFVLYDADDDQVPLLPDLIDADFSRIALAGSEDWSVSRRRMRGGVSDGVEVVELCSGAVCVTVLPTRGMGLWKAERQGRVAAWNSPVKRPVHPRHVELGARDGLGWLDGFNELLCRCGLAFNGPPGHDAGAKSPVESQLTLHGRIANLPAHKVFVRVDPAGRGKISVTGIVDECTLFGPQLRLTSTVTVAAGGVSIEIEDRVENLGSTETELELLYHINVGPPFLDAGAQLRLPASVIAPRDARAAEGIDSHDVYLGPTPGYAEQAYFYELHADRLGETRALLQNAAGDLGFGVGFNRDQLPCFTLWKCTQPLADGYVTGLEPATNYPNFKSFERDQGRVRKLAAGETFVAALTLDLLTSTDEVAAYGERIERLAGDRAPTRHRTPVAPYSPVT